MHEEYKKVEYGTKTNVICNQWCEKFGKNHIDYKIDPDFDRKGVKGSYDQA